MTEARKLYPGIMKVALEMAYSTGRIDNSYEGAEWLNSLDPIIKGFPVEKLVALNEFCLSLSDDEVTLLGVAASGDPEKEELQCRHSDRDFSEEVFYSIFMRCFGFSKSSYR